jgi:hypothetical protein
MDEGRRIESAKGVDSERHCQLNAPMDWKMLLDVSSKHRSPTNSCSRTPEVLKQQLHRWDNKEMDCDTTQHDLWQSRKSKRLEPKESSGQASRHL